MSLSISSSGSWGLGRGQISHICLNKIVLTGSKAPQTVHVMVINDKETSAVALARISEFQRHKCSCRGWGAVLLRNRWLLTWNPVRRSYMGNICISQIPFSPCLSIFWFACLTGTCLYYSEGRREDCLYMDESVELDSEVQISIASREWFTQCLPNVTVEKKSGVYIIAKLWNCYNEFFTIWIKYEAKISSHSLWENTWSSAWSWEYCFRNKNMSLQTWHESPSIHGCLSVRAGLGLHWLPSLH